MRQTTRATGRQAKFASDDISQVQEWVAEGLRSNGAAFMPNEQLPGAFKSCGDLGREIGTRGQTRLRITVTDDGRVINAFPVHVK